MAFPAQALFIAVVPYLGGTLPAGAALAAVGVLNGFGSVVMITIFQRWAPPDLLGRLTLPLAAVAVAIPLLAGLSQRTWRDFGMTRGSCNGGR